MLKKTIWILSIILVGLLSVSMINAIDNTTIDTNCIDDAETENQVILTQTNDTVGDFKELSELVESTGEGDTLKLYKDYKNTNRSNAIQIDKSMTVDGQGHFIDANHYSEIFFINATDVTLKNIKFINSDSKYNNGGAIEVVPNSVFVVENSSFANCSAELGGAIYVGANSALTISGSNFTNCFADSGGAIYFETGSTSSITNSNFNSNAARIMGGSLLAKGGNSLTLFETSFINSSAIYESGGAFALIQSDLKAQYINVIECNSVFGGAITLLSSNSTINGSVFKRNTAVYDGGAIFAMYDVFNLYGNEFRDNSAKRGGALYVSQTNNTLVENQFEGNSASLGDAVYAMACNDTLIENNTGLTQGNFYRTVNDNLIITSTDFNSFVLKDINYTALPAAYSMLDDYTLTPVKDQGTEGNCWAFAAMAVLESCIVKASNVPFDLSEANLKNLMALFSDYGFKILTNDGGFPDLAFGYLASWLGPIYEKDDFYSINDYLSPLLNTTSHIQNIILLDRESYTDNDDIKWAILRYGAVGTSMHFDYDYLKSVSYYYNGFQNPDHAVAIVGWDDNYSRNNFKNAPMGDGAWIVRNSWGPSWGNNGYFYVSYYDSKFAEVNEATSYTFILNDTILLNRNYQYEITFTSHVTPDNESNEACYKNIFTSQGEENLAAVSTYFIDGCDYNVSIYINDTFVTSKAGNSDRGYYTIYLDNMVGLTNGDVVTVEFNCTNFKNGVGMIPCSDKSLNSNLYLMQGVSYYWNGFKWIDFYSIDAIGCIKMFTSFSTQGKLTPYFQALSQKDVSQNCYVVTFVLPPDATGSVSININGKVEVINVSQTRSIRLYNLDESNNTLGLRYSGDERYLDKEMIYVVDLNSDKGDFNELKSKINMLGDRDTLNLTKDYCYVSGSTDGIFILNSVTIDGNGHIIDGNNQSAIFNIMANNTVLKNIRFVGSNNGDRRGAIYLQGSNCSIINCSFAYNFASLYGGAIYLVGSDCNIINCSFDYNFASDAGGAIIWFGVGGILENCSFVNNSAVNGGAIWMQGYASVLNCSFINNFASEYGGAIYWAGDNGTLANCCFVNNSAYINGGAICWAGDNGTLANCCFIDNSASNNGGAIRWSGDNANLIACEFIGNAASNDGGAVYSSGNECIFADSYFADNSASRNGGAVYLFGENCNLTNSSFDHNSGYYQIIWNVDSGNIVACYFIDSPNNNIYNIGVNIVKNYIDIVCNNTAFEYKNPQTLSFYVNNSYVPRLTFNLIQGNVVVKTFATSNISRVYEELAALKIGTWKLQVFFSGDDTYYSYDKTFTFDVSPAFSSLNVSLNNITLGHETTISATVSDFNGSAIDEGVVTFKDGDEVIGTVNVKNGLAELKFTPQKAGKHVIDATFTSGNYKVSNAFEDLFVDGVVVGISLERGTVGFNSTFAVEVTALYSNVSDGSVMFYIGNDFIGKKPVVNGIANMTYVPSVAGNIPLKVVYCESQIFSNTEGSADFIVDKASSSMVLNQVNGTVGREMILTAEVSNSNGPINDGTVTFLQGNDVLGSANVENGVAALKYSPKVGGKHQITARYSGNNYADSNAFVNVYINDVAVEIIAEPGVVGFDSTFVVNVSSLYSNLTDGSVSFYLNDNFIGKKSLVKGNANITYIPLIASDYVLKAVYGESQVFSSKEATVGYVVKPADSRIIVRGSDGVVGIALTLTANVSSSNNQVINYGSVIFYDGDSQIGSASVMQGIATLSYVPAFSGNRLISAQFVSDNYYSSKNNVTVYIEKAKVQIAIGDADVYYDTLATVGIDISSNGKPINEGTVKVYVNNQQIGSLNIVDGHVEFKYLPSSLEALNVSAVFDETLNYYSSNDSKMMTVSKLATNLEASSITEFYNDGKYLGAVLKDNNGKAIGGERVSIDLGGVKYLTTDAKGQVKLPTAGLKPKTYNVAITFDGSDRYLKSTKNVNVIVKKASPKLTASKKTFKRKVKVKKYTITLKNNVNKAMAKVKVTIKVKGKTFTAKTNSAGKATFKLKKLTKKGKYSATVTFKGDSCYNKVTKKVRIVIK